MVRKNTKRIMISFMIPGIAVMLTFFMLPVAMTIFYSFTNLSLTGSDAANFRFIGVENYLKLFKDKEVAASIGRTLIYTVASVVGQNVLGFLIAYLMQEKNRIFRKIFGPVILSAWVMPEVVGSICAYSVFTDKGTLNVILQFFGLKKFSWLYKVPMLVVIIANIWRGSAYSMMVYQAGLDNVPGDVKEAAQIDGAGKLQTVTRVIIPIIKDTIMTNTMLTTLMTVGGFGLIYIMTGGGPGVMTQTLPILMYQKAFKNYSLGYGTAISMILLLLAGVLGLVYVKYAGKDMGDK